MDFNAFVEGPLLWVAFLTFIAGMAARVLLFSWGIKSNSRENGRQYGCRAATFAKVLLPFHRAYAKKPVYATLHYLFHLCLFVVPVWLAGHIVLWENSRFGWTWTPLPDVWADWLTLLLLSLLALFLVGRMVPVSARRATSRSHRVLITTTALPFLTGYFLAHGTLDFLPIVGNHMRLFHVLSCEALLVTAAFLFCSVQLNTQRCTGCAACDFACPTGTLEANDEAGYRVFRYSHYQCISCGACVDVCPDKAADLKHEISLRRLFQIVPKEDLCLVQLAVCEKCGKSFAPGAQLERIAQLVPEGRLHPCPSCKEADLAHRLCQLT